MKIHGLNAGFQWLDGSFVEDKEKSISVEPKDLDVITFYYGRTDEFNTKLDQAIPEFGNPSLAKQNFLLDHYAVDLEYKPEILVYYTSYANNSFPIIVQVYGKAFLGLS